MSQSNDNMSKSQMRRLDAMGKSQSNDVRKQIIDVLHKSNDKRTYIDDDGHLTHWDTDDIILSKHELDDLAYSLEQFNRESVVNKDKQLSEYARIIELVFDGEPIERAYESVMGETIQGEPVKGEK